MLHQTSHEVLGHYVIHNVTKFQNYRSDNIFIVEKHFDKNNVINVNAYNKFTIRTSLLII